MRARAHTHTHTRRSLFICVHIATNIHMHIHTTENLAAAEAAKESATAQAAAAAAVAAARSRRSIGPYRIGAARNRRASSSSASSALHMPRKTVTHPRHKRSRAPMQATPDAAARHQYEILGTEERVVQHKRARQQPSRKVLLWQQSKTFGLARRQSEPKGRSQP